MSDTKKQNFDIVICGAGPGGAALASICADRGISTALIERQSEFSQEFRGEGIMPSGYEALKSIGFDLDRINLPWIAQLNFVHKKILKLADMMAYGVAKVELKV